MESEVLQHKLEAAKKHMNEVKKKKRETLSFHTKTDSAPSVELDSSPQTTLLQQQTHEIHAVCEESLNKVPLDAIDVSSTHEEVCLKKSFHEYTDKDENIHGLPHSLETMKSLTESLEPLKENLQVTIESEQQSEKELLDEESDPFQSIKILKNTINELKSQVSFLQESYLEMSEKLNMILLKMDANSAAQEEKKVEFTENERINRLETIVENLESKLEKARDNSREMLVFPKTAHQMQSQAYDYLSFEDVSLNTINTSPITKQEALLYHEICKIDLRKTNGCVGCLGEMFKV
ncbi:hypothetical protein PORY_001614 [Pneumocystis oryctolagi]|uniref:Uncharacterized protein n=1 Tax=Pneumocystis oryctolagi TaxID=42067 RepID=A0ACB7CHS6_9ASCO|nr:hypothetical protein PORY_001614 [Pneumocystis oryctolagi]